MDQGMALIRDGINRLLRTFIQQLVVTIPSVLVYLLAQPDLTDTTVWVAAAYLLYHGVMSGIVAFVHRTVVDPSRVPSLAPANTPSLQPPPYQPPVPGAI